MLSKSQLAIQLSKLSSFVVPNLKAEQYATDTEIAADILWNAYMNGDIANKTIADLGCGTGILGIGALLLGAKKVLFVENDATALATAAKNLGDTNINNSLYKLIEADIRNADIHTDTIIMNPPFGTKAAHADRAFLLKALMTAPVIYSIHKTSTRPFVEAFVKDNNARITHIYRYDLPLKRTQAFHKRNIHRIDVSCFRLERT
jgi:putative methylase